MTHNEERAYLLNLLFESARWRVDADDPMCAIELEIRDRIQRLTRVEVHMDVEPEIHIEPESTVPDDYKALEAAYLNEHLERAIEKKKKKQSVEAKSRWKDERVRIFINGKPVWKKRSECRQVPRDNSRGGLSWTWKWVGENSATVDENLPTKDEQCEAMWAEHGQSK